VLGAIRAGPFLISPISRVAMAAVMVKVSVVGIMMEKSMVPVVMEASVVIGVMIEAMMVVAIMMIEGPIIVAIEGPDAKAVSPGPTPTKPMGRSRGACRDCETRA